jgi:hypothetical protein
MRFVVAPTQTAIKIVTAVVILMGLGFLVGCFFEKMLCIAAVLIGLMVPVCYLRSPKEYEILPDAFVVHFHWGSKRFGGIVSARRVSTAAGNSLRLWGNGGVFAGTGIFWNSTWGIFRAYVTNSASEYSALVETHTGKVLVSPRDQAAFLESCAAMGASGSR